MRSPWKLLGVFTDGKFLNVPQQGAANEDGHEQKVLWLRERGLRIRRAVSVLGSVPSQHFCSTCHGLTNAFALAQAVLEKSAQTRNQLNKTRTLGAKVDKYRFQVELFSCGNSIFGAPSRENPTGANKEKLET